MPSLRGRVRFAQVLEHHIKASHHENLPNEKFRCTTCDAAFMAQMEWLDAT